TSASAVRICALTGSSRAAKSGGRPGCGPLCCQARCSASSSKPGARFKRSGFWVTGGGRQDNADDGRSRRPKGSRGWARRRGCLAAEALVAAQFQPVGVSLPGQQLAWALADALWVFTPREPPVVEVVLQQLQVVRPELPAQEEVVSQSAIQVLYHA